MYFELSCFSFQECGRAGRDGEPAVATLYYNNTDVRSTRPGITKAMASFCKEEAKCLRDVMLSEFGYNANVDRMKSTCCSVCAPALLDSITKYVDTSKVSDKVVQVQLPEDILLLPEDTQLQVLAEEFEVKLTILDK